MSENTLLDLVTKTTEFDKRVSSVSVAKSAGLTFKRDEKGVLWSYDAKGNKVGRIFEHGDDQNGIDQIKEV